MTPTNLILVDGIPGSGKSSTVHRLGLHLRKLGYNAHWFFEGEAHHPIYPSRKGRSVAATDGIDPEYDATREPILRRWEELTSSLQGTERITILDGSFCETPALYQQLRNRPREETLTHVLEVERILEPIDPILIYLYQRDVRAALTGISISRGPAYADFLVRQFKTTPYGLLNGIHDYEGVIGTYLEVRQLTDCMFDALRMRKLAIENDDRDWSESDAAIADALSISPIEDPFMPVRNGEGLVGTYRRVGTADAFAVATDGRALCVGGNARLRLIPETERLFHIEGTRVVLRFEMDGGGIAAAVEVFEAASSLSSVWTRA